MYLLLRFIGTSYFVAGASADAANGCYLRFERATAMSYARRRGMPRSAAT